MENPPTQEQTPTSPNSEEKKQRSGLIWFLLGGCITVLVVLCVGTVLGLTFFTIRGGATTAEPVAQVNTLAPIEFEVTNTPLSPEDLLDSATATIDPAAPTVTAKPFPTTPPMEGIPVPELGFEYGAITLHASNPSSFVAAAGRPQLVELFAFW